MGDLQQRVNQAARRLSPLNSTTSRRIDEAESTLTSYNVSVATLHAETIGGSISDQALHLCCTSKQTPIPNIDATGFRFDIGEH